MTLRLLSAASEVWPLVKTGGLADVVGALPAALAQCDVAVTTLVPGHPALGDAIAAGRVVHRWDDLLGVEARLVETGFEGGPLLVLDAPALFDRDGPYADAQGRDWDDNWRRYAAFARAAADCASGVVGGLAFDVVHLHDWQAALAAAYLRFAPGPGPVARSVVTIHNIAFQGWFPPETFAALGLPAAAWAIDGVEYRGGVGYLKAGVQCADAVTTVSPTYAREIREPAFGMGLEGAIRWRGAAVHGILNGIDRAVWNPASDAALAQAYTARTLGRRRANRAAVCERFGLDADSGPIATVVSRLTGQKGMDVLADVLDDAVAHGWRFAILGSGDRGIETAFHDASARHPGRIGVEIGYDEALSHLLQGGADAIVIPSRFEPCGLTQLYGLAYGCVPVVARTGGLADTVIDANEAALRAGVATGIVFDAVTRDGLRDALDRALALFGEPDGWRRMQRCAMAADFSWTLSANAYAALYRRIIGAS